MSRPFLPLIGAPRSDFHDRLFSWFEVRSLSESFLQGSAVPFEALGVHFQGNIWLAASQDNLKF